MKLTSENYFSKEASKKYMSVSQFKSFMKCEAAAKAEIDGEYSPFKPDAFLFGSLLHAWNEGKMEEFISKHPELYCSRGPTKGQLKAEYQHVYKMIKKIENDRVFKFALEGEKEKIFTAELFGVEWKIMIDNYNPGKGYFSDLKTIKSLYDKFWGHDWKYIEARYMTFIEHYRYDLQMIVYSEIEKLSKPFKNEINLTPYLAVITKEDPPDTMVINGFLKYREEILEYVKNNIVRIKAVKDGIIRPLECGKCAYCRSKKTTKIVNFDKLKVMI